jgi:uncharacterized protein (DUF433 family)
VARVEIVSDPAVMMGKPVVAGTRITVEHILEALGAGESIDDLLGAHPRLTREAIHAALTFAAGALRADTVFPAPSEPDVLDVVDPFPRERARRTTSSGRSPRSARPGPNVADVLLDAFHFARPPAQGS